MSVCLSISLSVSVTPILVCHSHEPVIQPISVCLSVSLSVSIPLILVCHSHEQTCSLMERPYLFSFFLKFQVLTSMFACLFGSLSFSGCLYQFMCLCFSFSVCLSVCLYLSLVSYFSLFSYSSFPGCLYLSLCISFSVCLSVCLSVCVCL